MDELIQAWEETAAILKEKIQPVTFNTWIKPIIPIEITDSEIVLQVPNKYNETMILDRYSDLIKNSLFDHTIETY